MPIFIKVSKARKERKSVNMLSVLHFGLMFKHALSGTPFCPNWCHKQCVYASVVETWVIGPFTTSGAEKPWLIWPVSSWQRKCSSPMYVGGVWWFLCRISVVRLKIKYPNLFAAAIGSTAPIQRKLVFRVNIHLIPKVFLPVNESLLVSPLVTHRVVQLELCPPLMTHVVEHRERYPAPYSW